MPEVSGGELVAQVLARSGVDVVFMLHGAHIDPIYLACLDHRIATIGVRHEAAAGHAAEGYARAGRRLGVALVTAGPGVTNIVTSMANAYLDRTPVVYLAGAASAAEDELNALQSGIDQVAVARPVTKWAHRIRRVEDITRLAEQAIRIATTAPTGPVFLEIPVDVLSATAEARRAPVAESIRAGSRIAPAIDEIDEAIRLLRAAKRPAIMAGGDVYATGAWTELRTLARSTSLPVFAQFEALGTLPCDDPLWAGTFWQLSQLPRTVQPDLVLALGVRFGWHAPGFETALDAEIIHIEVDPKEFGRPRPARLAIRADCRTALGAFNDRIQLTGEFPDRSRWASELRETIASSIRTQAALSPSEHDGIHPYSVVETVCATIGPDAVIVGDGAFVKHWLDDAIACSRPGSYFTHGALGAMGIGLGLAMGARLANPDRPVVCMTGDGSVGFTIAEFDSMVRHNIPVVTVVMNNRSWARPDLIPRHSNKPYPTIGTALGDARYGDVAVAFGGFGRTVERVADLGPAIIEALRSGLPACIDVPIPQATMPAFSMRALRTA